MINGFNSPFFSNVQAGTVGEWVSNIWQTVCNPSLNNQALNGKLLSTPMRY
uniref:Uncharacterized protein n=1 Tax=Serratia marcescens TaxID=615 RepID=A0A4P3AU31_SERMA|nr:TPA_exp: hypothetical protein [Serratia marcescens]DAC77147.1 TPA_exp: hypothetical protein [Serratia marcescens]DAC77191.1 TPA_exp: hypothetical protein [Serratia marcescens]DAC77236.1 TPA_exp: hypothetical protein [Serratia marcescens]DAC77279.1 TPA_exp: hypothetical protein [Serratia marcescens]